MKQLLLCLFLILTCCSKRYVISKEEKLVHQITAQTAEKLKEQKKLFLVGTGGQMMYEIVELYMGFFYYQEITIEKGRDLIVAAVEEYLSEINSCAQIKSYLSHYPFDPKNIHINIFIYNPDRTDVSIGKISVVSVQNGLLEYEVKTESGPFKAIHKETYDEALGKSFLAKKTG